MPSLTEVRAGLKNTLAANISGLFVYDTVPDTANLPAVVVAPDPGEFANYLVAMGRERDTYSFHLVVVCSWRDADLGQHDLDEYVSGSGAKSVRAVIHDNSTLGLANTHAHVRTGHDYGARFTVGGVPVVGAVLRCQVTTKS